MFGEKADAYLKNRAKKFNIRPGKRLVPVTRDNQKGFSATDLNSILDEWYDKKLRSSVYPQYKEAETAKQKILKEEPKDSAYSRLQDMIGLTEAGGKSFFLSHTVPEKKRMQDFDTLMWQEFIVGEPEYEKEYFPDKFNVTGHTPTGLLTKK